MDTLISLLVDIVKICVPALIVFFTAYYLLKQYIDSQREAAGIELAMQRRKLTVPLQLQAYERLSLFCERIALPSLLARIPQKDLSANEFQLSLLLAIQQEYEHNVTQQIYVSEQLWAIIQAARDDSMQVIAKAMEGLEKTATAKEVAARILAIINQRGTSGVDHARRAVHKEAALKLD